MNTNTPIKPRLKLVGNVYLYTDPSTTVAIHSNDVAKHGMVQAVHNEIETKNRIAMSEVTAVKGTYKGLVLKTFALKANALTNLLEQLEA